MRLRKDENLFFLELIKKNRPEGWLRFIGQFSSTILQTIQRCAFEYDEIMEIYVYAAEKLSENQCARLKQFRGEGPNGQAQFSTWLITLIVNFCRAWVRQKKGRRRLFESIKSLSDLDRKVFDLYFWQGYQEQDIVEILNANATPKIFPLEIHQSLQRINRALTQKNKWKIVTRLLRNSPMLSMEQIFEEQGEKLFHREPEPSLDPEKAFEQKYFEEYLNDAFSRLSPDEKQLLILRFQKGLSVREIGLLLNVANYKILYKHIENAVEKIRQELKSNGQEPGDFAPAEAKFHFFT